MTIERWRTKKDAKRFRARLVHQGAVIHGRVRNAEWQALEDEAALKKARDQGTLGDDYGQNRIPTFAEAAKEYLAHCAARVEQGDEAPRTYDAKATHLELVLLPRFGPQRLDEITVDQVEVVKRWLYRNKSGPTANRYLATLSGLFKFYRRRVTSPVAGVTRYEENTDAWQAPSRPTVEHIIGVARQSGSRHLAPIVLLCFEIAARIDEIRPLRWEAIDFDWCDRSGTRRGIITWERTKAGKRQTGPLSLRAREELLEQRMRVGNSDWCFPSPVQDAPISYFAINEAWHRVLVKARVPPMRIHTIVPEILAAYPAFSPDGTRVAFQGWTSDAGYRLYSAAIDGAGTTIIPTPEGSPGNASWAPDGNAIYYQLDDSLSRRNIWMVDLESGESHQVTSGNVDDAHPAVTRDGELLLFLRNHQEIYVMPTAGGTERLVHSYSGYNQLIELPSWSHDDTSILFSLARRTGDIFAIVGADTRDPP